MTRLLSQGYKINRLPNTFKKFYGRHADLVGQYKKNVRQMFADCASYNDFMYLFIYFLFNFFIFYFIFFKDLSKLS